MAEGCVWAYKLMYKHSKNANKTHPDKNFMNKAAFFFVLTTLNKMYSYILTIMYCLTNSLNNATIITKSNANISGNLIYLINL